MASSHSIKRMAYTLEICPNSIQSARNAQIAGADRIELCQCLENGGITPSLGLIQRVKQELTIPVHVLIRPRPGGFIYDDDEFEIMLKDIAACQALGCEGVVVGMLMENHRVDVPRTRQLVEAARPMQATFHRAFDDCQDQYGALEDVIETGCTRVLTSGGAACALEGSVRLAALIWQARERIIILPGAGIKASNVQSIIAFTGVVEVHASATKPRSDEPGKHVSKFHAERLETDEQLVRDIVAKLLSEPKLTNGSNRSSRSNRSSA